MRHIGRQHHTAGVALREPIGGVVDRFVVAVPAGHAVLSQVLEIGQHRFGGKWCRQDARVGRDHEIIGQSTLESQPGYAEGTVLIVPFEILGIVRGFRDPPRHTTVLGVLDLSLDNRRIRFVQQRAGIRLHHQRRHQVLEHRGAPREQRAQRAGRRQRSSEPEPVIGRNLARGDREEAGQAGFRCERVVVRRIEPSLRDVVSDGEELTYWIEQEIEFGFLDQVVGQHGQSLGPFDQIGGVPA